MEEIRLNKYLSEQGVCSRREADRLIEAGKVTIDGRRAEMGEKVTGQERIICDGKPVGKAAGSKKAKPVLLVVNKPRGIVCTTSDKDRAPNVVDLIQYPARVYPVGRLDKDSEGLLLMTNQGELANEIMHAGNFHEKEYLVTVDQPFNAAFLKKMREGVELKELGVTTRPCKVEAAGVKTFRIILTQGLNRQIRRMCKTLGYGVLSIKRVRVANILLGKLNPGDIRAVTGAELKELYYEVGKNASRPARPAWEKERQPAAKKEAQTGAAEPRVNGRIANAGMQRSGQNPAHRNAGGYAKTADRRQGTDGARKAEQRGTYRSTADSRTNGTYRSATDSRTNGTYRNGSRSGQTGAQKKRYE